jgi:hypothetical protein
MTLAPVSIEIATMRCTPNLAQMRLTMLMKSAAVIAARRKGAATWAQ